jgi:hypothetical protein
MLVDFSENKTDCFDTQSLPGQANRGKDILNWLDEPMENVMRPLMDGDTRSEKNAVQFCLFLLL